MLLIRELFVAKPGIASKRAKMFKTAMPKARVMTDAVGNYNTVIMEWEVESLAAFEKHMQEHHAGKAKEEESTTMKGYTEMYLTGRREIFRIVE